MSDHAPSAAPAALKPKSRLVASTRLDGTPVLARDGHKLASVHSFILDKPTGRVRYAILSYGGFLGLGQKYHPVPWETLTYSSESDGYVLGIDKAMLEGSPSFRPDDAPVFDEAYGERISTYYGTPSGSPEA